MGFNMYEYPIRYFNENERIIVVVFNPFCCFLFRGVRISLRRFLKRALLPFLIL